MRLTVLYHDFCFDGVASAAIFSRFYRERFEPDAECAYAGLTHQAGEQIDTSLMDGDENAIVDFKYSSSPRLSWWFDHHQSAFLTPTDEVHFRKDRTGQKFHDAAFKSCAKFIATVTRERFGFHCPDLDGLVEWADVIDGAQFPDARTAVELKEPALQLMLVIEGTRDHGLLHQIIRQLQSVSLHQVATSEAVQEVFRGLYQKHQESIEIIRSAARFQDGIIYFDLSETGPEGYNKFIPYYLYPTAQYSVGISRSGWRSKIAVGSNPWALQPRRHNLAEICERYGGGGHPVVAAISLGPDEVDKARSVASRIVQELRSSG